MPPGPYSPSRMFVSTMAPPSGVNESCDELTDPVVVLVEFEPCIALAAAPKRTSLPSMLPPGFVAVAVCVAPDGGEPRVAVRLERAARRAWAASRTRASRRRSPSPGAGRRPSSRSVNVRPKPISAAKYICRKLVKPLGFSNGWPELAL